MSVFCHETYRIHSLLSITPFSKLPDGHVQTLQVLLVTEMIHLISLILSNLVIGAPLSLAFSFQNPSFTTQHQDHGLDGRKTFSSDFWHTTVVSQEVSGDNIGFCESLDEDGPLPPWCYVSSGKADNESKPTCRIAVNLHVDETSDLDSKKQITECLQSYIDKGLTTFSLPPPSTASSQTWVERNVVRELVRSTPKKVMDRCQIVVPYRIPKETISASSIAVRRSVLDLLSNIGGDAIDTLSILHTPDSPYHLDILDAVETLKNDGFIRSTVAKDWPTGKLRLANDCGLHVDSSNFLCNILNSYNYSMEQTLASSDLGVPLGVRGVLAGGFLTDRYVESKFEPVRFSGSEEYHQKSLRQWAGREYSECWSKYCRELLPVLGEIALKYRVSIASVAIRWSLQLEHVECATVSCRLDQNQDLQSKRQKRLREVFSFQLDEEDLGTIRKISGVQDPGTPTRKSDWMAMSSKRESGLFLP